MLAVLPIDGVAVIVEESTGFNLFYNSPKSFRISEGSSSFYLKKLTSSSIILSKRFSTPLTVGILNSSSSSRFVICFSSGTLGSSKVVSYCLIISMLRPC
jgi:hypothetical protein